ncbi:hypothetical protein [Flavobacterium sp.]|uniref:hypothetical protein n=1 Tax=Flavobacterium sp. TaxID=239 RepID=UPI002608D565|nr:hypothetical protein [Flavobacterium sp.]
MKKTLVLFVLFLFISCDEKKLGNSYYYLPNYEAYDLGYPYGSIIYKSKNENVYDNVIVYSDILHCIYDDNYILIIQKPNKDLMIKKIVNDIVSCKSNIGKSKNSQIKLDHGEISYDLIENTSVNKIRKIADSIFENDKYYKRVIINPINFYIIDKVTNFVYGPFNEEEFLVVKKRKNIQLNFNDIDGPIN